MTSKLNIIKAWTDRQTVDLETTEAILSDDFQSVDRDGNVLMDKEGFLGMNRTMVAALPDIKWVRSDIREEGDSVIMSGHFEGTFTSDLDLSAMGMGVIPASGKEIVWPKMSVKYEVEGEKIVREQSYGDVSGFEDFLAPLGVKPPSA
jgi:predicted ester cyclase